VHLQRDIPSSCRLRVIKSFQAQAAHYRFCADSGHIAASHRSATKSADARRGAAVGGELRQAAGAAALVAADERGVTGSQPQTLQCTICRERQKPKFIRGFRFSPARQPVAKSVLSGHFSAQGQFASFHG
jgi:hypothetical protein